MELTIALAISIISVVITVVNFALSRKDKSNKETKDDSYNRGVIETKIDNLTKQVDKILQMLDKYDIEIDNKINNAIDSHIREYHKK